MRGDVRAAFAAAHADAASRGEDWNRLYIGKEELAAEAGYQTFLANVPEDAREIWASRDGQISRIHNLDPETGYKIKRQTAQGNFEGAFLLADTWILRSHLALVDPKTRSAVEAHIDAGNIAGGFAALADDRKADFRQHTGIQEVPDDPIEYQRLWNEATARQNLAADEAALAGSFACRV